MGDEVLSISLLGAFSVALGGEVIDDDAWRLRKAKTLIKLLALAPERRMHAAEAAELLWPDRDQASARNNLHQAIFAARRALDSIGLDGAACLELHDDLIELCSEAPVWIDVEAFEEAGARARAGRDASAYRAAHRWLETDGTEGLPVIAISRRRLVVPVAALRRLLETARSIAS